MNWASKKIGNRMKLVRMFNGMTQEDMGQILETTQEQYYLYESGKREIKAGTLMTFASFFNISMDFLTGLTNEYRNIQGEKVEVDTESVLGTGSNLADFLKYHPES